MSEIFIKKEILTDFCKEIFMSIGHSEADAALAADVLLSADLRGIDSHGVARLSGYVRLFQAGRINVKPQIKIVKEKKSAATIDGDGGLGLIVAPKAMEIAIKKAEDTGTCFVSVGNSNHFGIAAYHAMLPLKHDMIGWSMTNASPLVAPTHSKQRMLGTNPVCVTFPSKKHDAMVMDMATSAAANGKLEIASRKNKPLPDGWVQTKEGKPSVDADELKKGGSLLPLGAAEDAGHKGYGLASVVDILSGVLSGANYGPWVPPFVSFLPVLPDLPGKGLGHFLGAMQIDAFAELEDYYRNIDQWIDAFKNAERNGENPVAIHGEYELKNHRDRLITGIPVHTAVYEDLEKLSKESGVKL